MKQAEWAPERVLEAVQSHVRSIRLGPFSEIVSMSAGLDGDDVLPTFRWPTEPHLFGMRFHLPEAPEGPSTGEVCETPDEWAKEVGWVVSEELDTGLVKRGRRSLTADGVVELHWRPSCG